MGTLTQSLPFFMIPSIPLTIETLQIIFPYSLALAIVGLLESLLTASIVDDMTDTDSDKAIILSCWGISNVLDFGTSDIVVQIPMTALVGVMFMVAFGTFDWSSLKAMKKVPLTDSIVMVVTVATVVITHDLSKGVFAGIILSAIFFVAKISRIKITSIIDTSTNKRTIKLKDNYSLFPLLTL
jgi:SulP family sulfate permease